MTILDRFWDFEVSTIGIFYPDLQDFWIFGIFWSSQKWKIPILYPEKFEIPKKNLISRQTLISIAQLLDCRMGFHLHLSALVENSHLCSTAKFSWWKMFAKGCILWNLRYFFSWEILFRQKVIIYFKIKFNLSSEFP